MRIAHRVAAEHRTNRFMEGCVDLSDNMPDGVMFLGLDGRLFERIEVRRLTVRERAGSRACAELRAESRRGIMILTKSRAAKTWTYFP
jgi:hypothetical protein